MTNKSIYDWTHTIPVEDALWIYDSDIICIEFACLSKPGYVTLHNDHIELRDIPFLSLYKKEILLEPSNHSLVRLSIEVAESLFFYKKALDIHNSRYYTK